MSNDDAIKEIEVATNDLQVFAVLNTLFGSEYTRVLIAALVKVEELAVSKTQGRRK